MAKAEGPIVAILLLSVGCTTPVVKPAQTLASESPARNDAISQIRHYAHEHKLPWELSQAPNGWMCVSIGDVLDNKNRRTSCRQGANEAAQKIMDDINNGRRADYDSQYIDGEESSQ